MRFFRYVTLWHPESPGIRVVVKRWFPWFRRSGFATLGEVLSMRKREWRPPREGQFWSSSVEASSTSTPMTEERFKRLWADAWDADT